MQESNIQLVGSGSPRTTQVDSVMRHEPQTVQEKQQGEACPSCFRKVPVCIVGMACHLPGGIRSPLDLWKFLINKKSAQGRVPADRFNIEGYYSDDVRRAGVMNADGGYFIQEDVRQFEHEFFGISRQEALSMDPQQRKLLEVVFECFEDAGISMAQISGTNTGVYVGNFTFDHLVRQTRDADYSDRYSATGSGIAIAANRISHVFDLHGPSFTLDTGCSSSLHCLHNAVNALQSGECEAAVVASANLITAPEQHLGTMKGGVISPSSTCHTFDAAANGYGRADAVNALILKPLASALRDGDKVWAVIRGSAINSDGRTPGISHPNCDAQEAVILKAYKMGGIDLVDTDYVECHGTGTATGDLIEVAALQRCFTSRAGLPVIIGSAKPGLGHSEAASGLTSVIKVVLALYHARIPPTCGIETLNPRLHLDSSNMMVATEMQRWPRNFRRASVNAFGYGGANAHCILESSLTYRENPCQGEGLKTQHGNHLLLLPISAASTKSLSLRLSHISHTIEDLDLDSVEKLAYTLAFRRSQMRHRGFLLAQSGGKESNWLIQERSAPHAVSAQSEERSIAFIYTGQGAQYAQMSKELLQYEPLFLGTIQELDEILQELPLQTRPAWTLEQTIGQPSESSLVNDVSRSQPLCTAIQIALTKLMHGWGIVPRAVVGHSSGEIAAAHAAGLITTRQAILTAYFRGFAASQLISHGGMMAVGISAEDAESLILQTGLTGHVSIACVNAPRNTTLSGSLETVNSLYELMTERRIYCRKLETGGRAYHSNMMKEIGQTYENLLQPHYLAVPPPGYPKADMFSSVGISSVNVTTICETTNMPKYWRDNLEQPVQFNVAVTRLLKSRQLHLVEVGPHPALKVPIQQIIGDLELKNMPYSPTLIRKKNSYIQMKQLAGELYLQGQKLDWKSVNGLSTRNMTLIPHLPPYPWDYSRGLLWAESRASVELRKRQFLRHELLGTPQLAGDGIGWKWRNILHLSEAPWLLDHKVEAQIVFPAVGYLAMIMVAMSQIGTMRSGLHNKSDRQNTQKKAYEFHNVRITAALVLDEEMEHQGENVELHTTVWERRISAESASSSWFEFQISSWRNDCATTHCSGSIRITDSMKCEGTVNVRNTDHYETWPSMHRWYAKLAKEGLCFGKQFQLIRSLQTDRSRTRSAALSHTVAKPMTIDHLKSDYPVHPLAVDACVQAAIFGSTAGDISTLRAYLPVFISLCRIAILDQASHNADAIIHSQAFTTGPTTKRVDCTLWGSNHMPLVHLQNIKMIMYNGKTFDSTPETTPHLQRYPFLLTYWKPDLLRLGPENELELQRYLEIFLKGQNVGSLAQKDSLYIRAILDLSGHKNPRMRVLELVGHGGSRRDELFQVLGKNTGFPRYRSWHVGTKDENDHVAIENDYRGPFDVILVSPTTTKSIWSSVFRQYTRSLLNQQGLLICDAAEVALQANGEFDFSQIANVGNQTIFTVRQKQSPSQQVKNVVIIVQDNFPIASKLAQSLLDHLRQSPESDMTVDHVEFSKVGCLDIDKKATYIILLELEEEFLASVSQRDMDLLHHITDEATDILWLTGSNTLDSPKPNLVLSSGLSRALSLEQPSIRFVIMDVGCVSNSPAFIHSTCGNVSKALQSHHKLDDREFAQHNGMLYISRLEPDFHLNAKFRSRLKIGSESHQLSRLYQAGKANLSPQTPGSLSNLYFQQECAPHADLPAEYIDVSVKAVSVNAKDVYAMAGYTETRSGTNALEFAGVVTAVGNNVKHMKKGDRVLVAAPVRFSTAHRVPAWAALQLNPDEDFSVMASLPIIYCTALYALVDRAHLAAGESVLIHSGAGALGIAAITIARQTGATVYTTASSPAKKSFLMESLGIPSANIFNSRDNSFVDGVMNSTDGKGVDVVLNSLTGDLMHASWRCIANFGRFVEVGKKELVDAGKLELDVFQRNATFTAFDLMELFYSERQVHRDILYRRIKEVIDLYRSGQIKPVPITKFDVGNIAEAYSFFSSGNRVGKIVISLENSESLIRVAPPVYQTCFDRMKVYLLVGCLGGLGRSLTRWMISRGARNFVFLGRTGQDNPAAREMISYMGTMGATAIVVRGDVSHISDVIQAVDACQAIGRPIGGVVQAAMALSESLFYRMSADAWSTAVRPKWMGTWNLHRALEGFDKALDFFMMMSSVSGSIGSVTESNYCAANAFLDAFASWRRNQHKPAVSIGLGMIEEIGYLQDNPEIQALLLRRGIQPFNENEFLQIIDLALSDIGNREDGRPMEAAHILTGLEPLGIRDPSNKLTVSEDALRDPRLSIISAALESWHAIQLDQSSATKLGQSTLEVLFDQALSSDTTSESSPPQSGASLQAATLKLLRERFSTMLSLSMDQIDNNKSLAEFGIDSMLATEIRTWLWNTLKVDIPFLDILSSEKSMETLATLVAGKLKDASR
ncbi:polyketide synthase-like protein [Xylaria arbuscula]|nr:polyketide synthase-like protein [Xylaria arbuscula]